MYTRRPPASIRSAQTVSDSSWRVWSIGWTSGKLSEPGGCGLLAEVEEDSWIVSVALLFAISVYFACGVALKKLQGESGLPHQQFWSALYGLVVDGVGFVVHGGKRVEAEPLLPSTQSASLQSTVRVAEPNRQQQPLFTEFVEKFGDENQQELKGALEQQGTAAAKLALNQLEMKVLKQQLEKLGLPTTGPKTELEARLRQATER